MLLRFAIRFMNMRFSPLFLRLDAISIWNKALNLCPKYRCVKLWLSHFALKFICGYITIRYGNECRYPIFWIINLLFFLYFIIDIQLENTSN